jgi:hypothetical protein
MKADGLTLGIFEVGNLGNDLPDVSMIAQNAGWSVIGRLVSPASALRGAPREYFYQRNPYDAVLLLKGDALKGIEAEAKSRKIPVEYGVDSDGELITSLSLEKLHRQALDQKAARATRRDYVLSRYALPLTVSWLQNELDANVIPESWIRRSYRSSRFASALGHLWPRSESG